MLDPQPFNNTSVEQVFVDDFINIFPIEIGIPDLIRVDHDYRAKFAAIETTRTIYYDISLILPPKLLDSCLGIVAYFRRIALFKSLLTLLTLVSAEKYMVLVIRHM